MEEYLTKKGIDLVKFSIRNPDTIFTAQTLWVVTWLHRYIQEEYVPRIYLNLLVELGYLEPKLIQDMDLDEADRKIREYGMEVIRESPMSPREKRDAVWSLWDEDDD